MTTPVVVTVLPTIGLVSVVPWMSAMLVWPAGASGAVGVAEPLGVGLAVWSGVPGVLGAGVLAEFIGLGVPMTKSAELSSVSSRPRRWAEVVFDSALVGFPSALVAAP